MFGYEGNFTQKERKKNIQGWRLMEAMIINKLRQLRN